MNRIDVTLDTANLAGWLTQRGSDAGHMAATDALPSPTTLSIPARLKRTGLEMRFVADGADDREADISLTRIMVRAHAIRDRLLRDDSLSIDEVAREEDVSPSYVTRLTRSTFLAPDIITGILTGCYPPELTAHRLMPTHACRWHGMSSALCSASLDYCSTGSAQGAPSWALFYCEPTDRLRAHQTRSETAVPRNGAIETFGRGAPEVVRPTVSVEWDPTIRAAKPRKQPAEFRTQKREQCQRLRSWRRGGDSNPRYGCPYAAFRVRCFQPLSHLSWRLIWAAGRYHARSGATSAPLTRPASGSPRRARRCGPRCRRACARPCGPQARSRRGPGSPGARRRR